jgi:hypothetical protein
MTCKKGQVKVIFRPVKCGTQPVDSGKTSHPMVVVLYGAFFRLKFVGFRHGLTKGMDQVVRFSRMVHQCVLSIIAI